MRQLLCYSLASLSALLFASQRLPASGATPRPPITAMTCTPDGRAALFGSQQGVFLTQSDGPPILALATELEHVHHLAFSDDGSLLAVAGGTPAEYGAVEVWSWPDCQRTHVIEQHDDVVYAVQWLANSKTIVTAAADRKVRVWDVATGQRTATLAGHSGPVLCLAASLDGRLICSGSADQTIRVWDTNSWNLVRALTNHLGPVQALAIRPLSASGNDTPTTILASAGGDGTVRFWQPDTGRMLRIVRQGTAVLALGWSSDRLLHCGRADGQISTIVGDTGEVESERRQSSGWITSLAVPRNSKQLWFGDSLGHVEKTELHK